MDFMVIDKPASLGLKFDTLAFSIVQKSFLFSVFKFDYCNLQYRNADNRHDAFIAFRFEEFWLGYY